MNAAALMKEIFTDSTEGSVVPGVVSGRPAAEADACTECGDENSDSCVRNVILPDAQSINGL
jgi:hypothetical protein